MSPTYEPAKRGTHVLYRVVEQHLDALRVLIEGTPGVVTVETSLTVGQPTLNWDGAFFAGLRGDVPAVFLPPLPVYKSEPWSMMNIVD